MTAIEVRGLHKEFSGKGGASVTALDSVDLIVAENEIVCLLGPSGCGKTTTLRSIAGLEDPDAGYIKIGDQVVYESATRNYVPVERRGLGMVFQTYALWPHMTVFENVMYPLRKGAARHSNSAAEARSKAERMLAVVDCKHLKDRYPGELSGGQQQRVALARALAYEPKVMLFDEPLSNLDAKLRTRMRFELSAIRERIGFTGLYVTHDQEEALSLSDRMAVMAGGRICQLGTPTEVYEGPVSGFVADFVGAANVLPVIALEGNGTVAKTGPGSIAFHQRSPEAVDTMDDLQIVFRPEHVVITTDPAAFSENVFPVTITARGYHGTSHTYTVENDTPMRIVDFERGRRFEIGSTVYIHVPADRCRLVPSGGFVPGAEGGSSVLEELVEVGAA